MGVFTHTLRGPRVEKGTHIHYCGFHRQYRFCRRQDCPAGLKHNCGEHGKRCSHSGRKKISESRGRNVVGR